MSADHFRAQRRQEAARSEILGAWRRVDPESAQLASQPKARPLGAVVAHVLKGFGLDRKRAEAEVLRVWNRLLDPQIVAHARPVGLRKGTLFVAIDSHVWLDEIVRYRRREILDRLQHSFGKELIAKISFRVG